MSLGRAGVGSFLSPLFGPAAGTCALLILNGRNGQELASHIERAFDSRTRRRGLLGRTSLPPGTAMILAPCWSIHTCFMRFRIDVLFLSRDGRVLKARHEMRPWRISVAPRAFAVVELPAGAIARSQTERGDRLLVRSPEA